MDLEPAIVPALLRACLAGDAAGVAAIVDNTDPLSLLFGLAAWSNEYGIATKGGSVENWDVSLAEIQRQMSGL
jgi:hypothetical protein